MMNKKRVMNMDILLVEGSKAEVDFGFVPEFLILLKNSKYLRQHLLNEIVQSLTKYIDSYELEDKNEQ